MGVFHTNSVPFRVPLRKLQYPASVSALKLRMAFSPRLCISYKLYQTPERALGRGSSPRILAGSIPGDFWVL